MKLWVQCSSREHEKWKTISIERECDAQAKCDTLAKKYPDMAWRIATESEVSNAATADWSISLDLTCPYCNELIDLLADDWPEGVQACEQDTDATRGVEVECPGCDHTLIVDYQY
jgi:hypothetical protein